MRDSVSRVVAAYVSCSSACLLFSLSPLSCPVSVSVSLPLWHLCLSFYSSLCFAVPQLCQVSLSLSQHSFMLFFSLACFSSTHRATWNTFLCLFDYFLQKLLHEIKWLQSCARESSLFDVLSTGNFFSHWPSGWVWRDSDFRLWADVQFGFTVCLREAASIQGYPLKRIISFYFSQTAS